jgi:hypothetical protein
MENNPLFPILEQVCTRSDPNYGLFTEVHPPHMKLNDALRSRLYNECLVNKRNRKGINCLTDVHEFLIKRLREYEEAVVGFN